MFLSRASIWMVTPLGFVWQFWILKSCGFSPIFPWQWSRNTWFLYLVCNSCFQAVDELQQNNEYELQQLKSELIEKHEKVCSKFNIETMQSSHSIFNKANINPYDGIL